MRLAEALEQSATGTLRRVAGAHGLPNDDGTTRAELIERIAERFADPVYVKQQLGGLADDERDVLISARPTAGELRSILVDRDHPGAAEALAERGWLYRVFAAAGPLRGEVFVAPDEVLAALPSSEGMQAALTPAEEPPAADRRWTDPNFSLFVLVSGIVRGGGHLADEVQAWSEEPGGWASDKRWQFLRHLAASAGLLTHRADGTPAPAPGLVRLLDEPPTLGDRLWRSFLREGGWSELAQAGFDGGSEVVDALALRAALVDVVQRLPEGTWIGVEALSSWLERTRPRLFREQLTPRGVVQLQALSWSQFEASVLRFFVLGPLYWLGTVLATADGKLFSRRLAGDRAPAEACRWEGAADLVAPARAELGTLLQAERYLVLRERGRVSRYHLVQSHVAAALGSGGSIGNCRQLLQRLTQAPLPREVDERLMSWEQRFGSLTIRPAVLIEARSEVELDAAISDQQARPFIRGRRGPLAAEVAAADALELAAALRASGHLPRVDAALRLAAEPRRAYSGLVDEQVLEFLLVSLLAFRTAWPERLAELEGSLALLERLEHEFPPERLARLQTAADRLAGALGSVQMPARPRRRSRRTPRRPQGIRVRRTQQ